MRDKLLLKDGKVQPKLSQKFQPYLNLDDAEVIKSNRCAFDRYVLHAHTLSDDIRLKEEIYGSFFTSRERHGQQMAKIQSVSKEVRRRLSTFLYHLPLSK